jgi:hypothetical protein
MRTEPEKMMGSWGMIASRERKTSSPIWAMSMPSMEIEPLVGSTMRKSALVSVDLPAPVLPTIPICCAYKYELTREGERKEERGQNGEKGRGDKTVLFRQILLSN